MMARQLDHAPSAEELPFTIQVMAEDLAAKGLTDADCDRLSEAFRILGPSLDRWPTSRIVIESLPTRKSNQRWLNSPDPKQTPEVIRREIVQMRGLASRAARRCVFLPSEGFRDYCEALAASGEKKVAFDARRLRANGWTAAKERAYGQSEIRIVEELERLEREPDPEAEAERAAIQEESP